MTDPVKQIFSELRFAKSQRFNAMTMVPILAESEPARDYLHSQEALRYNGFSISEISRSGSVPRLKAVNKLNFNVLLIDGEELIGAKQNRTLNTCVLIGARSKVAIPVSCVEQGRWQTRHGKMSLSGNFDTLKVRSHRVASVSRSLKSAKSYDSAQGEVWEKIRDEHIASGVRSPTSALSDVYRKHNSTMQGYIEAFKPDQRQVGCVIAVNDRWTGVELFRHARMYAVNAGKIIRSHAVAAQGMPVTSSSRLGRKRARRVLNDIAEAKFERFDAVGLGTSERFNQGRWQGAALQHEDTFLHLVAFRDPGHGHPGPVTRGLFSRARRG